MSKETTLTDRLVRFANRVISTTLAQVGNFTASSPTSNSHGNTTAKSLARILAKYLKNVSYDKAYEYIQPRMVEFDASWAGEDIDIVDDNEQLIAKVEDIITGAIAYATVEEGEQTIDFVLVAEVKMSNSVIAQPGSRVTCKYKTQDELTQLKKAFDGKGKVAN